MKDVIGYCMTVRPKRSSFFAWILTSLGWSITIMQSYASCADVHQPHTTIDYCHFISYELGSNVWRECLRYLECLIYNSFWSVLVGYSPMKSLINQLNHNISPMTIVVRVPLNPKSQHMETHVVICCSMLMLLPPLLWDDLHAANLPISAPVWRRLVGAGRDKNRHRSEVIGLVFALCAERV